MNYNRKSSYRDDRIISLVEQCGALNTTQIQLLLFREMATGQRKAQQRLKVLYERKQLRRYRTVAEEPYIYYTGRISGRADHLVALNWVYVWLTVRANHWDQFIAWEREPPYGLVRPDAFYGSKNVGTGEHKFIFVELDRSENRWDKVQKYTRLYQTNGYAGWWWRPLTKKFPQILCVTTIPRRLSLIQRSIDQENTEGLRFEVKLLEDIIKEATAKCKPQLPSRERQP